MLMVKERQWLLTAAVLPLVLAGCTSTACRAPGPARPARPAGRVRLRATAGHRGCRRSGTPHRVRVLSVLASQLRSPLLLLLAATAIASAFLGQRSDAVIIG